MPLKSKIETVINSLEEIKQIMYEDEFNANEQLDYSELPVALMFIITDLKFNLKNGNLREKGEIQLFFLNQETVSPTGENIQETVSPMQRLALKFLVASRESGYIIDNEENINIQTVYDEFDASLSGVTFRFTAIEKQGICESEL